MSVNIAEFLMARIEEDEQVARLAGHSPSERWIEREEDRTLRIDTGVESMGWEFGGGAGVWDCPDPDDDCGLYCSYAETEASHIARHDPARVLAECKAKRAIVYLHRIGDDPCDAHDANYGSIPCDTILTLAAIYRDHPDFDPEWSQ